MPKLSAGLLIYRTTNKQLEVFLVHPGGPFWANKDLGAWSVPKGEYAESEDVKEAAKREFQEEVGQPVPAGEWQALSEVKYSNKVVTVWAIEGGIDTAKVKSNTFTMEWPPRSGQKAEFPEVDKGEWFDLTTATEKLVKGQVPLVEELAKIKGVDSPTPPVQESLF